MLATNLTQQVNQPFLNMSDNSIEQSEWRIRESNHIQRIRQLLGSYPEHRAHHIKDPVFDFLFEYYSFRPSMLERWSPGAGIILKGRQANTFLKYRGFKRINDGIIADTSTIPERRLNALNWIYSLLLSVGKSKPFLGCYGIHEWAMVYKTESRRHPDIPLRISNRKVEEFVDTQPVICSHYDAYRFFTKSARHLNYHRPGADRRLELEQSGCIHVTMDLYKWAYKPYPWIQSELIADAFELAIEARKTDMRASPYDLKNFGLPPIPVETKEGRDQYRLEQQSLCEKAKPIRYRLIKAYEWILKESGIAVSEHSS